MSNFIDFLKCIQPCELFHDEICIQYLFCYTDKSSVSGIFCSAELNYNILVILNVVSLKKQLLLIFTEYIYHAHRNNS